MNIHMKNNIIFTIILVFLMGCNNSSDQIHKDNLALVEKYIKAVEELDYSSMEQYLDDSYIGVGPSYGDTINKAEAIENWQFLVENLYEKIKYNKSRMAPVYLPDGENKGYWVTDWAELNIKYQDGDEITIWANSSYQIEGGKIVKSLTLYNEADALRQMGYIIIPESELY
jgi:hypothetical protein